MPHTISHRHFFPGEQADLRRSSRVTADSWAWVAAPVMALGFLGLLLGKLLGWAFGSPHLPHLIAAIGGLSGIGPSLWVYRSFALDRKRTRSDATVGTVEVIEVTDPTYLTQDEYNDEGPIFYLDIGGGKILFLWGQWLYDPSVFPDSSWHATEQDDDSTFPFPTSHFRVHRSPQSGRVLKVEVLGSPISPAGVLPTHSIPLSGQRASEILEATLTEAAIRRAITQTPSASSSGGGA